MVISGRVRGTYRDDYAVTVHLASSRSGAVTAYRSQCTCPSWPDCKHAAAVLLVARHLAAAAQLVERPEWEKRAGPAGRRVRRLRRSTSPRSRWSSGSSGFRRSAATSGRQDLRIRPARLGKAGTLGPLRDRLGRPRLRARSYVSEHRELLLQFRAAAGASARYALPRSAWLSLRTVGSGFWGLLDQAAALGLTLITAKPLIGPIRSDQAATVGLDLRRSRGRRAGARPAGRARRRSSWPACASGCSASRPTGCSGPVRATTATEELCVARLEPMIARELRQLIVEERSAGRASGRRERFLAEFVPPLQQNVPVTSTDGSVRLPDAVAPSLAVTAEVQPGHRVRLDWTVRYLRETRSRGVPAGRAAGAAQPPRLAAERGRCSPAWSCRTPARPPELDGSGRRRSSSSRSCRELAASGVEVELLGDVLDYRLVTDSPADRRSP